MVDPQKYKNKTTIWSGNPLLSIYPMEMKSVYWRDVCTPVLLWDYRAISILTKILFNDFCI
jgi:hypothetical protein